MEGGSLLQKVKHELINPLKGMPPRYDTIYIVVGKDREKMANDMSAALMKAVNKFEGYEHVKVMPYVTGRNEDDGGTGVSGTALRNAIKTQSPEKAFAIWSNAFNKGHFGAKPLPAEWIKHLMDVARKNMGITAPPVTPHTSPSGAKTTMNPKDDDYAINYGKDGMGIADKQPEPVGERMLPKKAFAGSNKNKLGTAGQARGEPGKSQKAPLKGLMVGEENVEEEKQRLDPKCWKGYRKAGTKMKGGKRVNNCVPVSEEVESIMGSLISLLEQKK